MEDSPSRSELDQKAVEFACEVFFYFSFTLVVLFIIYGHTDITTSFRMTKNVEDMFVNGAFKGKTEFLKVTTVDDLWAYLTTSLVDNLNSGAGNFTSSGTSFLIGTVRLRQVRIQRDTCRYTSKMSSLFQHHTCNGDFVLYQEDTENYNGSWLLPSADLDSDHPARVADSMYSHQSAWDLSTLPFLASRATYPGGGYVLILPRARHDMLHVLQSMQNGTDWLDERTRALFVEFSLYNPNVNLFSVVVLVFEFCPDGAIAPYRAIFTSRLYHYATHLELFVTVCEIAFVLYVLAFVVKETRKVYLKGFGSYLRNFWTLVELAILGFSVTAIGVFFKWLLVLNEVMAELKRSGGQGYVSFHPALVWNFCLQYVMALLSVFVVIKFFKLLRFNEYISAFPATLRLAAPTLIQFSIVYFVFVAAFASLAAQTFASKVNGYQNFGTSCLTLYNFALGVSDYFELEEANFILGPFFFFAFNFIVHFILLLVFISTILEAYHAFRHNVSGKEDEADVADYMWKMIKSCQCFLLFRNIHNESG